VQQKKGIEILNKFVPLHSIMNLYGIIGNPLGHSVSPGFFEKKFREEGLNEHEYRKFELQDIDEFPEILAKNETLRGVNVTSPYKESVIRYINITDQNSKFIGAVNVVKIRQFQTRKELYGYNTDAFGFETTLLPYTKKRKLRALILGSGGGSKAVEFVLKKLGISYEIVSRRPLKANQIIYWAIDKEIMDEYRLIINATPLGMSPNENEMPLVPLEYINPEHIVIDLIYNPEETLLLKRAREAGATTVNGKQMFEIQAEKTWEIWNSNKY